MRIDVIALFPEIILPALQVGILKRTQDAGNLTVNVHNLRDFTADRHQTVDDYPYGGGAGDDYEARTPFRRRQNVEPRFDSASYLFDAAGHAFNAVACRILFA